MCFSKTYIVTKQVLHFIFFAFEKFISYSLGTKFNVHIYHSALRYLMYKNNSKPRFIDEFYVT